MDTDIISLDAKIHKFFVSEIQKETNRVILGTEEHLLRNGMYVTGLNMMKYPDLIGKPLETVTKVRYKDAGTPATIEQIGNKMKVLFHEGVSAVAPGQAAVFYEGNDVVGGGWIAKSFKQEQEWAD